MKKTANCVHLPFLFPSVSLALLQLFLCLCLSLIRFPLLCVHFMLALFLERQPLWGDLIVKWSTAKQTAFKMNGIGSDNPSFWILNPWNADPLWRWLLRLIKAWWNLVIKQFISAAWWLTMLQSHQHTVQYTSLLQQLHFLQCCKIYNVFH